MSTKCLLPNQHTPLHLLYGRDDCCLCRAQKEIDDLKNKIQDLTQELLEKTNMLTGLTNSCKGMRTIIEKNNAKDPWIYQLLGSLKTIEDLTNGLNQEGN